jgi:hypothetical protein
MKFFKGNHFAGRETRASVYFATLFGTAVITILVIRGFLAATGYPQVGGDSLHIAHMLWGGLFMLLSIITLLYLHGHWAKVTGSIMAGVGFGLFIDEIGKFITKDNDYFYQPAAMLIYVIFLLLWALFEWLDNYTPKTNRQKYIDALTRLRDGAITGLTDHDKLVISKLLKQIEVTKSDEKMFFEYALKHSPHYRASKIVVFFKKLKKIINTKINLLINNRLLLILLYGYLILSALFSTILIVDSVYSGNNIFDLYPLVPTFIEIGYSISVIVTIICVFVGVYYTRKDWLKTLIWCRRAMMVNIFVTQVFLFYINQFSASFGFIFSLLILLVLNIMVVNYEKTK